MRVSDDDLVLNGVGLPPHVSRLKRRADFVHVGKGRRWHGAALTLQVAARELSIDPPATAFRNAETPFARVGFTLTKRVGCAVVRNRARRRLRDAVRLASELPVQPGYDYVVVGRLDAIRLPFDKLKQELVRAWRTVHETGGRQASGGKPRRNGRAAAGDSVKGTSLTRPEPERTRPKS